MNKPILVLILCALTFSVAAHESPEHGGNNVVIVSAEELAKPWELTADDWMRYQKILKEPGGFFHEHLSPLQVLGMDPDIGEEERQRFVEIHVNQDAARMRSELSFQKRVHETFALLYPLPPPVIPPLQIKGIQLVDKILAGRYAVVLPGVCEVCGPMVGNYIEQANSGAIEGLDIYVGLTGNDDAALHQFIQSQSIPVELIAENKISVNHTDQVVASAEAWAQTPGGEWERVE